MKKRVFTIALAAALVGTMMAQEVEHRKEVTSIIGKENKNSYNC